MSSDLGFRPESSLGLDSVLYGGVAFAQGQDVPGVASGFLSIAPLLLIFLIFYFLLIRPQQKKAREHREMLAKLEKGDVVITTGGIYGRITGIAEETVTLEVADNVRVKVAKEYIATKKGHAG